MAVKAVLDASREICLRRYEKPVFRGRGWAAMLRRQGEEVSEEFGDVPRRVLAALWDWRCVFSLGMERGEERRDYLLVTIVVAP